MRPRKLTLNDDRVKFLPRAEPPGKVRHLSLQSESTGAKAIGALAVGAKAIGTLAIGAVAVGALAMGALAIGRLVIGRARIRRLKIDELVVRRLRVTDEVQVPAKLEPGKGVQKVDALEVR
jgi:hypothetical protein